ncbi:MAG: DUF2442 domain-containing protein [Solobacterium sp.]|nr:DUF2442 domain-containing protein [Solobacterium sp.]
MKERFKRNLTDCTLCSDYSLLCFFRDDTIRKVQLKDIPDDSGEIAKILRSSALFASAQITPGGYAVTFNNSIDLMAHELYTLGQPVPLQKEDFFSFLRNTILDTAEACELLECSRQNLAYLTRTEQLVPVRKEVRGTLYSKGDILKTRW